MAGYLDGCGDIILKPGQPKHAGCEGKISYLGGHSYGTTVPLTSGSSSMGTRLFLNALFEAQCTVAGGGGGGTDTDGDGVDDTSDPFPDDPTKCGDSDSDGCDDCSSGTFDPSNDCAGGGDDDGGQPSGCCETGGDSRQLLLAALVGFVLLRPRRRRR